MSTKQELEARIEVLDAEINRIRLELADLHKQVRQLNGQVFAQGWGR